MESQILQKILDKASNVEIIRAYGNLTIQQVLDGAFPSLARLKIEKGIEMTEKALAVLLADASKAFDNQFKVDVALELAAEITSTVGHLSLEDCFIALRELKQKDKIYKLTPNNVLVHFKDYSERRIKAALDRSYNNHLANKENPVYDKDRTVKTVNKAFEKFRLQYEVNQRKKG
ncbi:MAG: hypothetical protein H0X62_14985 [Bacteroidetes bacterium]|nr:hypothetical protein [Bacteroidota bacterium]